jgi:predicted transcriptional regulator
VPLSKVAKDAGVEPGTMRRRLLALDHAAGGGIVRSFHRRGKARKYWVHPERLRAALERDPDAREAELSWLTDEVRILKNRVEALKKAHKALKAQVNQPRA